MLQIQETEIHNVRMLKLKGELVRDNAQAFRVKAMEKANGQSARLILEMWDVDFIDSSGLAAIIGLGADLKKHGRYLALYHLNPEIKRVLTGIHAGKSFSIITSL